MKGLAFISCTRGRKEDTDLYRSLQKLGADHVRFFENNRTGLPKCYNAVLDERAGRDEIVVFVHDDVTIGDFFLEEKLFEAFEKLGYAVAGLAGSSEFRVNPDRDVTTWRQPPEYAWSGAVEHEMPGALKQMSAYGPTPRRCVVLDGLFLAVNVKRAGNVRFDEQFAFHFYDLDFCLNAHRAGVALGTISSYVTHKSGGYPSAGFNKAQQKFRAKWGTGSYELGLPTSTPHRAAALPPMWQKPLQELPLGLPSSAWVGHIPFLFLLFKLARPRTFVELGVDLGASFLAACEAARRYRIGTRCVGIDSWTGDAHAGFYDGTAVFDSLRRLIAVRYSDCALLRQTFDQAIEQFADGGIDLLHIDGLHTYDAVSHDFATWLPKLSDRSVVLFHDIEVRNQEFGVFKFWAEAKARYRSVEFKHGYGLGVLLTGTSIPKPLEDLITYLARADRLSLLQEACKTAASALASRIKKRGRPHIAEIAAFNRLIMHRGDLTSDRSMERN